MFNSGRKAALGNQKAIKNIQEGINGLKEIRILGREEIFLGEAIKAFRISEMAIAFIHLLEAASRYLVELMIIIFVVGLIEVALLRDNGLDTA